MTLALTDFSQALSQGAAHAWLFIPTAVLLGALHGLEPGHSKTMMAAFIIAIRGTVWQATLLGLSAAISHSFLIWILAAAALKYGGRWNAETTEPYFQLVSAVIIAGLALWMFWRTRRDSLAAAAHEHEHHHHGHDHVHDDTKLIKADHGIIIKLSVFETGVPPVFRLAFLNHGKTFLPKPSNVSIETVRPGGVKQTFAFVAKENFLESTTEIPEPHAFDLTVTLAHDDHSHTYPVQFSEHDHDHGHTHDHDHGDLPAGADFQDAHEAAHALDIQKRFMNRTVTTPQIVLFGLTGGLMPCPAAFTVLIVCMQVKQFTLGFALVAAFSFGLALTMVTVGAVAAWSVQHAEKKFTGFGNAMRKAPYLSCALLLILASYMAWQGWHGLPGQH
ncbi:MAG: nickel/cobalt efflux transporter [Chthoniobacter sp.]|nr:nickel/cobalt efflux transporter [Chthoniobacter sp.]